MHVMFTHKTAKIEWIFFAFLNTDTCMYVVTIHKQIVSFNVLPLILLH